MKEEEVLEKSRALWNRSQLDLDNDGVLAQLLDRGGMAEWGALYRLAKSDAALRLRIKHVVLTVPVPLPRFWLAALASLGESIDWNAPIPDYFESSSI